MSNNRAELLKKPLLLFYSKKSNIEQFADVIEKRTPYSLRVIEWFCNNYSKKYDIIYKTKDKKDFNVYLSYKAQLDSYQKKQFDPFKRKHEGFETFEIKYNKNKTIYTTVGQLNFFRWCILNGIFDYIKEHLVEIKKDMVNSIHYSSHSNSKDKTKPVIRKKRQPLSVSATRTCIKKYKQVILEFD